jgi:hypothetical protein
VDRPTNIQDLDDASMTASQGYRAMAKFLTAFFEQTSGKGRLGTLVDDVELQSDGTSTDPAAISDWSACVRAVLDEDARR